ncbi:MAG: hypothetical protein AABZ30_10705 [Myxococcota bacterium]
MKPRFALAAVLALGCAVVRDETAISQPDAAVPLAVGAVCSPDDPLVCAAEPAGAALLCDEEGAWEIALTCPDAQVCLSAGPGLLRCGRGTLQDTWFAVEDTSCANLEGIQEGTQVCSYEGDAVLFCRNETWAKEIHCAPGPCRNVLEEEGQSCWGHFCDRCGYSLGDDCAFTPGEIACSTDGRLTVHCAKGRVAELLDCAEGETCTYDGVTDTVGCARK